MINRPFSQVYVLFKHFHLYKNYDPIYGPAPAGSAPSRDGSDCADALGNPPRLDRVKLYILKFQSQHVNLFTPQGTAAKSERQVYVHFPGQSLHLILGKNCNFTPGGGGAPGSRFIFSVSPEAMLRPYGRMTGSKSDSGWLSRSVRMASFNQGGGEG